MPTINETFSAQYEQFKERDGQSFKVIGKITRRNLSKQPDASEFDAEVLPMYRIKFADGFVTVAWPEEVESVS